MYEIHTTTISNTAASAIFALSRTFELNANLLDSLSIHFSIRICVDSPLTIKVSNAQRIMPKVHFINLY